MGGINLRYRTVTVLFQVKIPGNDHTLLYLGDSDVSDVVGGALRLEVVKNVPPQPLHWSENGDVERLGKVRRVWREENVP
jgi:hypothetical protein